jgi:hypothetical protein
MKTRTVSKTFRQSGPDHRCTWTKVPAIRLTGKWLAHLGFAPGSKFTVRVEGSVLRLEVA